MSVKILIVFICTAVGTAAGYFVMCIYKRNFDYLDGVCKLLNELKRNISYRRDAAASVRIIKANKNKAIKKQSAPVSTAFCIARYCAKSLYYKSSSSSSSSCSKSLGSTL